MSAWINDSDLRGKIDRAHDHNAKPMTILFLAFQSLGIVYGDIGTSPLYVFESTFAHFHATHDAVMGSLSLIFWTLTLVVLFKYVGVVMHANDCGEGGTFAMYSLLCRHIGMHPHGQTTMSVGDQRQLERVSTAARQKRRSIIHWLAIPGAPVRGWFRSTPSAQRALLIVTMVATSMVLGDGILTPAISVLSAVSGLSVATSITQEQIVGVSIAILAILFLAQGGGTQRISMVFAPIILLWLLANGSIGAYNLSKYGTEIFQALNPVWVYRFFLNEGTNGWIMLGGVMLSITGAEAMFADLGHFTVLSINISFCALVYPSLIFTYLGQASFLLVHPNEVEHVYFASLPKPIFWPMLVLATLAAVTASQALITGSFSIIRQAITLGVFPRLRTVHTGASVEGQVYIAEVNYTLMVLCIAVVAGFKDTVALGNAYGVAVMSVMVVTTSMTALVMLVVWELAVFIVVPFWVIFSFVETAYLSATLSKVPQGGWFALAITFVVSSIMLIWWAGSSRMKLLMKQRKVKVEDLFVVEEEVEVTPAATSVGDGSNFGDSVGGAAGFDGRRAVSTNGYVASSRLSIDSNAPGASMASNVIGGAAAAESNVTCTKRRMSVDLRVLRTASPRPGGHGLLSQMGLGSVKFESARSNAADQSASQHLSGSVLGRGSIQPPAAALGFHSKARTSSASQATPSLFSATNAKVSDSGAMDSGNGEGKAVVRRAPTLEDVLLAPPPRKALGNEAFRARISAGQEDVADIKSGLGRVGLSLGGLRGGTVTTVPEEAESHGEDVKRADSSSRFNVRLGGSDATSQLTLLRGLGIYYSDTPLGVPQVLLHFLNHVQALHEVSIFLTIRVLPLPTLTIAERLLVKELPGVPNFYMVVARFGYMEQIDQGEAFLELMCQKIVRAMSGDEDGCPEDSAPDGDVEVEEDLEEAVTGLAQQTNGLKGRLLSDPLPPGGRMSLAGTARFSSNGHIGLSMSPSMPNPATRSAAAMASIAAITAMAAPKSKQAAGEEAKPTPASSTSPVAGAAVTIPHTTSIPPAAPAAPPAAPPPPAPTHSSADAAAATPPHSPVPATTTPTEELDNTRAAVTLDDGVPMIQVARTDSAAAQVLDKSKEAIKKAAAISVPSPTTSEQQVDTDPRWFEADRPTPVFEGGVNHSDSQGGLLACMPRTSMRRISKVDPKVVQATQARLAAAAVPSAVPTAQLDPLSAFFNAYHTGVVYYLGKSVIRTAPANNFFTELLYGHLYRMLVVNSFDKSDAWRIPEDRLIELGMCMHM